MRLSKVLSSTVLGAALLAGASGTAQAAACEYYWTKLEQPAGAIYTDPAAASGTGIYAGVVRYSDRVDEAVVWENDIPRVLGPALGGRAEVFGVNAGRVVVGSSVSTSGGYFAVKYENGSWQALPAPPGMYTSAHAINEKGDIVGIATTPEGKDAPILWPAGSPGTYEFILPPGGYVQVGGVDEDGSVAVGQDGRGFVRRADGTVIPLEPSAAGSIPAAVSNGLVVGGSTGVAQWDSATGRLLRVAGDQDSEAIDVNSAGQVVGAVFLRDPVIWRGDQVETVLPKAGGSLVRPVAIDEDGSVLGRAKIPLVARCM